MSSVGRQADGTWVLSENVHLDDSGQLIPRENSTFIWIGHLYQSVGIHKRCDVKLPLNTRPLTKMLQHASYDIIFYPA